MLRPQVVYVWLICIIYLTHTEGGYKFNSLQCHRYAPDFGNISHCIIKAIDRKHNMMNLAALPNVTIHQFEIHFKMLKRESGGWHPYMYDMSVDICKFFVNPRAFFIPNLIYSFIKPFTNVNHTCPYPAGSELRLWNWTPNEDGVFAKFPVDHGQYGMHTTWFINKVKALTINGSVLFYK